MYIPIEVDDTIFTLSNHTVQLEHSLTSGIPEGVDIPAPLSKEIFPAWSRAKAASLCDASSFILCIAGSGANMLPLIELPADEKKNLRIIGVIRKETFYVDEKISQREIAQVDCCR